jgi:gluconokinase
VLLPYKAPKAIPQLTLICGVSGSGKSTVAKLFAERNNAVFIEGDDYHAVKSKMKMSQGIPLNEEDRAPWLARLRKTAVQKLAHGYDTVVSYSGLNHEHRAALLKVHSKVQLIMLAPGEDELKSRLQKRKEHFFDNNLLSSQLETLELPAAQDGILVLTHSDTVSQICAKIEAHSC